VIFDLTFCDSVAYAVPGNLKQFPNASALAAWYDNSTQNQYTFFDYAMQQIPCDIDSTAQYSLARNCTDCRNSYKSWLCSVMIPRCMDYSSTAKWLQERNIVQPFPNGTMLDSGTIKNAQNALYLNSSRNPNIDTTVQPGPYKEILPCEDLCYDIVRSCPSSMGFSCPLPGQAQFSYSYGQRPNGSPEQEGQITCNYPGAAYHLSAGHSQTVPLSLSIITAMVIGVLLAMKSG
jgi:calcium channel MID1